jgi:glutaconate CoA-transferase subunit B
VLNAQAQALPTANDERLTTAAYTRGELMVACAAREIHDGEVVFVGMRLPLIAFVVAKRTHAPNAIGLFENGVIRSTPAPELIYTMADPPNILGATQCLGMLDVMSLLQSGRVHLGFLGAAEVDRYGNLNSTEVRGAKGLTRLPGSGGACDIASLAQRFVVLLEHSEQRLPERVSGLDCHAVVLPRPSPRKPCCGLARTEKRTWPRCIPGWTWMM